MSIFLVAYCAILLSTTGTASAFTVTSINQHAVIQLLPRYHSSPNKYWGQTTTTTSLTMALSLNSIPTETMTPRQLVQAGEQLFKKGQVQESIQLFDKAEQVNANVTPYLWQRGISYYYDDDFKKGSQQFRIDVKVNPLDVEEIVWDIACQARMKSAGTISEVEKMALPLGRTDRRRIMGIVYSLFRGDGATEHDLAEAGHGGSESDDFYALFYLGLYCESNGEDLKAAGYMRSAINTPYAKGRGMGDYMTSCARVHCSLRHWI